MNKHIELVEKWLADPLSVSRKELNANNNAARAVAKATENAADAAASASNATEWVSEYYKAERRNNHE